MRDRMTAAALAVLSVLMMPLLLSAVLDLRPEDAAPKTVVEETPVASEETENRRVSEILIHQAETERPDEKEDVSDQETVVTVEIGGEKKELTLSDYLCGVLMGEMPASFPMEALKAQAVAARTYTLRRMESGGVLSDDPSVCQAYYPPERAEEKYGEDAEAYLAKLRLAVEETDGQVMTYEGDLIAATYFSCSGGKTESAQAVWGSVVPYLVSVESPGEEDARSYESTVTLELADFLDTLEIPDPGVERIDYTEGGGVETMVIGGKAFSGVELRALLGLRSTNFTMEISQDQVTFHVLGYGHRVGLSQYGAKAMAEAGHDYREILTWYYSGAELAVV